MQTIFNSPVASNSGSKGLLSIRIRLLKSLYEDILADLYHPHPFANERIGFLFTRAGAAANGIHLIFPLDYVPVPDNQYLLQRPHQRAPDATRDQAEEKKQEYVRSISSAWCRECRLRS